MSMQHFMEQVAVVAEAKTQTEHLDKPATVVRSLLLLLQRHPELQSLMQSEQVAQEQPQMQQSLEVKVDQQHSQEQQQQRAA
jgi:sensor histidine kinase YesM